MMLHEAAYSLLLPIAESMPTGPLRLIHAYQNSARIPKPYAVIRIDTIAAPQHEQRLYVKETGYQTVGGWRRATVEVQVYGSNAGACARRFMLALATYSSLDNQATLNVAIGNRLLLSEIPELLNNSQYEERGIHQFEMFYSDEMEDFVGLIEKVEITYEQKESIWDENDSRWDEDRSRWDYEIYCRMVIEAYPPYTPIHPEQQGEQNG
jgi:hypothetical protein